MKWILWVSALSIEISSFLIFFYEQSYDKSLVFLCCCLMMSKWKRFGCCIFMNCCRRLDELLGRDSWNSWDVDFLAAAGITWTLQQCAQQGCSHQLQEKAFSQFRAGASPSLLSHCCAPAHRVWLQSEGDEGLGTLGVKDVTVAEVQSSEAFHGVPCLHWKEQLRDPVIPSGPPPWMKVSCCSTRPSFLSFQSDLISQYP